jgi:hypothetical protein
VQVLNRVTWDNIIMPPEASELGWKETVRISPLEDTYVALRPIVPTIPFGLPDSIRLLNPAMPEGATGDLNGPFNGQEAGFNNTDTNGNPMTTAIVNAMTNFGWEYVWHCHMLSHEEMDMMRPMSLKPIHALPAAPVLSFTKGAGTVINLAWTDGTPVSYLDPHTWTLNSSKAEIGYRIERAPITAAGTAGAWAKLSTALANQTQTTDEVAGSAKFFYRVVAWNAEGESTSNAVMTADPPGFPTAVTPTASNGKVVLNWTAPTSDGGAPITGYAVQRSVDNGGTWTTVSANSGTNATTGTVTGLTNGTSYVFRVAAVNAAGTSTWSATTAPVVPDVLPAAPTIGKATAGDTQVTLTWTAPTANGGSAPSGYQIQKSINGGTAWTTAVANTNSTAVSAVVTGLTNGTAIVFRVAAINGMGVGSNSGSSTSVTPTGPTAPLTPAAPTAVAGGTGSKAITVSWVPPGNGGSAITGYVLQYSSNAGATFTTVTGTITASPKTVTGLTAGLSYSFRVAAKNAIGTGLYSGRSNTAVAR